MRLFEMFMGPLEAVKPWSTAGVEGVRRFLDRVWRLVVEGGGLDANSPYLYLVMCSDFADTCRVAYDGDALVGFVVGYHPPTRPDAY